MTNQEINATLQRIQEKELVRLELENDILRAKVAQLEKDKSFWYDAYCTERQLTLIHK